MKQNYIDGKGNYHNELNYTLAQIYDSGVEFGFKVTAQGIIEEFEKLKAEIKEVQSFSFRTRGECEGLKIALEIIDNRISKLKGEQESEDKE